MPTLSPNDRLSLCRFIFSDGRACRSPRTAADPHFCFYHAQKEAESQAVAKLAEDLTRIFSGGYVSAGDLSAALSRLIPAVLLGHIKPRAARTIAYMLQTFVQTVRLSQHEVIQTFGAKTWRKAVVQSLRPNRGDVPPPAPDPETNSAPRAANKIVAALENLAAKTAAAGTANRSGNSQANAATNGRAKTEANTVDVDHETQANTVAADLQTLANTVARGSKRRANLVAASRETRANPVVAGLQTRASSATNGRLRTTSLPQSPALQAS